MLTEDNMATNESDRFSSRNVLVAIALVAGLAELAYAVMNISAMPIYLKERMHYSTGAIGGILVAFLICEGVMKGPFGVLGDRIGRKKLIFAGPLVSVFTSVLTVVIHPDQWYLFVALRILDGLGAAALWPAALAMIADLVPEHKRSQAMSLFNVTYLLGVAFGPFVGGHANDLTAVLEGHAPEHLMRHVPPAAIDPLKTSFYVVSVLFLLTALIARVCIPHVPPHHERHDTEGEAGFDIRALAHSLRQIPHMLLMAFVTFLGIGLIMPVLKLFAMAEFKLSESDFGNLLLFPCILIAAASIPLGTIGDRVGKARAVKWGIGLCAISLWSVILIPNHLALILGGSLIGIGFVIAFPSWMAHISSSYDPAQRGAIMGAVGTAQGMGAVIGAAIGGHLYDRAAIHIQALPWLNSHYTPFIGCAGLLLVAWGIVLLTIHESETTPAAPGH